MYSPLDDFLADHDYYYDRSSLGYSASRLREVREASERLQLLNRQVTDLEDIIRKQGAALSEKDAGHKILRSQLRELKEIKERQIRELSNAVQQLEERNQELDQEVKEKSENLEECQRKLLFLDKFLTASIPSFENLISNLKKFTLSNGNLGSNEPSSDLTDPIFASLTTGQITLEACDSGHPSSASDSYNNVLDDYESNKRKLPSDVHSLIRSAAAGALEQAELDRSRASSKVHRVRVHRKNSERTSDGIASLVNEMVTGSPKHSCTTAFSLLSTPNLSPTYTPPVVRRHLNQPSKLILPDPVSSSYLSDVTSYSYTTAARTENELELMMNLSDEETDVQTRTAEDEPPPPAPPPTTNPGNNNLPSIQAPRRFLPSLTNRYN